MSDAPLDLSGSVADHFVMVVEQPMILHNVQARVTTLVAADMAAPVVSVDYTPVGGSRTEWGTITFAEADAVGDTRALHEQQTNGTTESDSIELKAGAILYIEHKTQATDSGTAAGACVIDAFLELVPDYRVA